MRRAAAALAIALASVGGGAWLLAPRRPAEATRSAESSCDAFPQEAPPAAPSAPVAAIASRVELPIAESEVDAEGDDRAVERAVAALTQSLADPTWCRASWDDEVGATAASLPAASLESIARRLRDPVADDAACIVLFELLRASGAERDALVADAAAVEVLRRTALPGILASSRSQVAARALAWLGGDEVLTTLVDLLCRREGDAERAAAAWALRSAPAERIVAPLGRRLQEPLDDRAAEFALITLDAALMRRGDEAWPNGVASATDATLARLLSDPELSERTKGRALAVGATLAARRDDAGGDAGGAALLRGCLDDASAPAERRLHAAELLVRLAPDVAPSARRDALDHLVAVARDGAALRDRRRARSALAGSTDSEVHAELVAIESMEAERSR